MKKFRVFIVCLFVFSLFCFAACENATQIRCATISEITTPGSENCGVRINFQEDSRLVGKIVDIQVKFSEIGDISIWEENKPKTNYEIKDIDEWYSITSILSEKDKEKFENFEEAISRTYLFNFNGKNDITLRVVVGAREENVSGTGELLIGSEPISDQFVLKIR